MSTDAIDLIRRLPNLYYAVASVLDAGRALPVGYPGKVRALADAHRAQLAEIIKGADLPPASRKQAEAALETLCMVPGQRARINAAGHALMDIPREGAGDLSEGRGALIDANLKARAECIHDEATATRTLAELLHTLAA
jgi:hypothetical protein